MSLENLLAQEYSCIRNFQELFCQQFQAASFPNVEFPRLELVTVKVVFSNKLHTVLLHPFHTLEHSRWTQAGKVLKMQLQKQAFYISQMQLQYQSHSWVPSRKKPHTLLHLTVWSVPNTNSHHSAHNNQSKATMGPNKTVSSQYCIITKQKKAYANRQL